MAVAPAVDLLVSLFVFGVNGTSSTSETVSDGTSSVGLSAFVSSAMPTCILAITVPIGTTSFSANKISFKTPAVVLGTSLSTLSVAISKTASSNSIWSPGCLCHFNMVASMILSPSFGIIKSTTLIWQLSFFNVFCEHLLHK